MGKLLRHTVAIVDDHPIVRQGLSAVLGSDPGLKIVAEGASAAEAVDIAEKYGPDLIILDLDIPGRGMEALRRISAGYPSTQCVVLTVCDRYEVAIEALEAGAKGYVLKGVGAGDLRKAVETVLSGSSFITPEFAAQLVLAKQPRKAPVVEPLSHRENQVMNEVERGLTNKQIAEKLHISEKTVKYYMSSLMQKLEVKNRVSAVIASQKLRNDSADSKLK